MLIGNEQVASLLGLIEFPTTFLVDRDGKYYSKHLGLMDRAQVDVELSALLNQPH